MGNEIIFIFFIWYFLGVCLSLMIKGRAAKAIDRELEWGDIILSLSTGLFGPFVALKILKLLRNYSIFFLKEICLILVKKVKRFYEKIIKKLDKNQKVYIRERILYYMIKNILVKIFNWVVKKKEKYLDIR